MSTHERASSDDASLYRRRFEALVQAHSAFVWTCDREGKFVDEQSGWAAYTGQTFEEYSGIGGFAALHPEDRRRVWKEWARALKNQVSLYVIDMRLWHAATQSWRWCTLRGVPVLDESGEVIEWVGSATDIDEAKRNEVNLRESERRFRSIMECVQAVGLTLDAHGRITFVNDYLMTLTGWTREEVIGRDYFEIFIDPNCFIRDHFYTGIVSGDIFPHAENEIITRSGERRMVAWDNTVLRDSNGEIVGVASIGRDITEKRKAEQELRKSEERLRLALQVSRTGIWEVDVKSETLNWSDECFVIYGVPKQTFDGSADQFWKRVHPDDLEMVRAEIQEFVAKKKPLVQEFRIVRPDGEVRWVSSLGHVTLDENQNVVRLTGTVIDVTSRKQTEEALRKAERFAAAGRMAATVAHEINNPLASLVNVVYLLGKQELQGPERELLSIANAELSRVVRISKQTLGFYQGEKVPANVDIVALVEDVKASFEAVSLKRNISLTTKIRGEKFALHGIGDEIRQVLINALTNALESGATRVEVRVRGIRQGRGNRRSGVRVSVIDNGKGIDRENVRRLFEPFFTTKGEKGTGLGLWVSRGIVLKHEGEITMRSSTREGRSGTCLSIFLPTVATVPLATAADAKV